MSETEKSQADKAREALEALEQAYAYYTPEPLVNSKIEDYVEYYEYASAA